MEAIDKGAALSPSPQVAIPCSLHSTPLLWSASAALSGRAICSTLLAALSPRSFASKELGSVMATSSRAT